MPQPSNKGLLCLVKQVLLYITINDELSNLTKYLMVAAGTIRMPQVIIVCEEHPVIVVVKLADNQMGKALVVLPLAHFSWLLQELHVWLLAVKLFGPHVRIADYS